METQTSYTKLFQRPSVPVRNVRMPDATETPAPVMKSTYTPLWIARARRRAFRNELRVRPAASGAASPSSRTSTAGATSARASSLSESVSLSLSLSASLSVCGGSRRPARPQQQQQQQQQQGTVVVALRSIASGHTTQGTSVKAK